MGFDRVLANDELLRDAVIARARRDEFEDFDFARRKRFACVWHGHGSDFGCRSEDIEQMFRKFGARLKPGQIVRR